ncbi:MAG TPA: methyltransferase domain-containing protein [Frankiaceae bacterium]|nr:methyltransferase domain-containing protein [Frankiaceae bacterium]
MSSRLSERLLFVRSFLANPRQVGAVLPTSRRAVGDMLDMADVPGARLIVELGAGTGSHTGPILERLAPDARLIAFEIDPDLAGSLQRRYDDPRLEVIAGSAEQLPQTLGEQRPDIVVSALPFTSLPGDTGRRILEMTHQALAPDGVFLVLQYSVFVRKQLHRLFGSVRQRWSPLNVPPAFLFACSRPRADVQAPT